MKELWPAEMCVDSAGAAAPGDAQPGCGGHIPEMCREEKPRMSSGRFLEHPQGRDALAAPGWDRHGQDEAALAPPHGELTAQSSWKQAQEN